MLKVWGRANSINVQKVMWTVAELGLPHRRIDAGGAFGGLDTPEFGRLNPNRRVPVLEDGDFVLWESNAIVRYLALRHGGGGLGPSDPQQQALAGQWMDWKLTTLIPPLTTTFWGLIRTPPEQRDTAAIAAAADVLAATFPVLDAALAGRAFLLGDELTMADIPVGAATYRWYALDLPHPQLPHLRAWYERLTARPAFRDQVMIPLS